MKIKIIKNIFDNTTKVIKNTKKKFKYSRRRGMDVVMVIPYKEKEKKILLIKEYRKEFKMNIWKLVSGGMDKEGLTPLQTAKEELAEEMSMESTVWFKFYTIERIFRNYRIMYFVSKNPKIMENPPKNPDEDDEIVDQKWVNLKEYWEMIDKQILIWNESTLVGLNFLRSIQ